MDTLFSLFEFIYIPIIIVGIVISYIPKKVLFFILVTIDILLAIPVVYILLIGGCGIPWGGEATCLTLVQHVIFVIVGLILVIGLTDVFIGIGIGIRLILSKLLTNLQQSNRIV